MCSVPAPVSRPVCHWAPCPGRPASQRARRRRRRRWPCTGSLGGVSRHSDRLLRLRAAPLISAEAARCAANPAEIHPRERAAGISFLSCAARRAQGAARSWSPPPFPHGNNTRQQPCGRAGGNRWVHTPTWPRVLRPGRAGRWRHHPPFTTAGQ
jgi:hypothetical protein